MASIWCACLQALGIALKLTFTGQNQFTTPEAYFCILVRLCVSMLMQAPAICTLFHPVASAQVVGVSVVTQMNYLNKALDLFNTAIVSPIYYVMFTTCTITASSVLFQVINRIALLLILGQDG